jgi:hypothetical protein
MNTLALVIPTLWIIRLKSRASVRSTCKNRLSTGNATAPPPSGVNPATNAPSTIIAA